MKSIEIGGKEYRIEYDINAGCDMEDRGGKMITQLLDDNLRSTRLALWGGLRKHHPDLTLLDAGDLVTQHEDRVKLMQDCLEEMIQAGFFGKAAKEPPKKTRSRASGKPTQG